ncbi:MAG: SDR family NAD(P)-dependent oxidoreductase [Micromonosporaceae bacterium]|jgi:NAD(P)-dependent dehydrogenase (short-subunit alcohol dehydrogenase family)|nr:SDR family NAD(P)-dependent oxidoreductase [Micromonosporaceae bacterium]
MPVVVVTGASSGIGLAAAKEFARRGNHIVMVGRDPDRLAAAKAQVPDAVVHQADFAVLDEVRALAEKLRADYPAIHVLANNAGAVVHRRQVTVDGFELTMQANHLAPFLLTNLLLDRLSGGRVVVTASAVHAAGALDPADLRGQRPGYRAMRAYASSKQANVLFAAEAARRWPQVLTTSYHPGVVRTRFGSGNPVYSFFYRIAPLLRTPEEGADTLVWLATAPAEEITNGGYYYRRRLRTPARNAVDRRLAADLWEASLAAVGLG